LSSLDSLLRCKKESKMSATVKDFISDMISNSFRKSKGKRYSDTTKRLLALLSTRGSPVATDLFAKQLGLCSRRTIEEFLKSNRRPFVLGFSLDNFEWLAKFYKSVLTRKGVKLGSLLVMSTEDETAITGGMSFCNRSKTIYGHCGRETESGHKCDCTGIPVDVERPDAYSYLQGEVNSHRIARCTSVVTFSACQ
jgi:hypothetical protein